MKWKYYHTVWVMLFLGWFIAYVDRNLLSPVAAYMIDNKIAFFADVKSPHALAGLMSALFFAGYMAMQFPAGYIGDRLGRKPILVLSLVWAAVGTFLSALFSKSMMGLLGARVLTGLGEGCYYSNDRALITETTPKDKLGVGLGVSFIGLGMGLVGASVGGAWALKWAVSTFGPEKGWYIPFYIWSIPTIIIAVLMMILIKKPAASAQAQSEQFVPGSASYGKALIEIAKYAIVFFILIMGLAYAGTYLNMSEVGVSILLLLLALGIMFYIMTRLGKQVGPVFFNKNLQLIYWGALPIIWTLWFYSFWAIKVIKDAASSGLSVAATTSAMFGLSALVGLPLMGWISDICYKSGRGRKPALILAMIIQALFMFALAYYLFIGGKSLTVLGFLVFGVGVFFYGTSIVSFALTADIAPPALMASAFGLWNLIAEIGAILSPVVSGVIRDATNSWVMPVTLTGVLMVLGVICIAFVVEPAASMASKTRQSVSGEIGKQQ